MLHRKILALSALLALAAFVLVPPPGPADASMWWEFVHWENVAYSSPSNGGVWIAHPSQAGALGAATGAPVFQASLASVISGAGSASMIRYEGGVPDSDAVAHMANLGFVHACAVPPSAGFDSAVQYTD